MPYNGYMAFDEYQKKDNVTIVFTGEGKGKTSAGLGLLTRALGAGFKVIFIQFIKHWDVSEHQFIRDIQPIYNDKLTFYKGGLGFYGAGELSSSSVSREDHIKEARKTFDLAVESVSSGDYRLVICDEINNAVHDGLLSVNELNELINKAHPHTSLCLTGRGFPESLIKNVDIATNMTKLRHHFDDKFLANPGIDY